MEKKIDFKKYITSTNVLMVVLVVFYLLDRYLPLPKGYTGYTAWDEDLSPAVNYLLGYCGGLLSNYLAIGSVLVNGDAFYRHLTQMFLHEGLLHLAANLVGLFFIGNLTEKKFGKWLTPTLFVSIAFIESFITDPLYLAMFPHKAEESAATISLGASGGVFGLMGVSLAALLFDIRSFKTIGVPTIVVSVLYGVLATYVVSFGWTTVCHNVAMILGLIIGVIIILPFYIMRKRKARDQAGSEE